MERQETAIQNDDEGICYHVEKEERRYPDGEGYAAMISNSYDISDKCYVEPIVAYVKDNERNIIE